MDLFSWAQTLEEREKQEEELAAGGTGRNKEAEGCRKEEEHAGRMQSRHFGKKRNWTQ